MESLLREILEDLINEIDPPGDSDIVILISKIKNAYREVKRIRNYPASYTEEAIAKDMENYYSNIRDLALYDFNQVGVEGQISHNENGTSRTWKSRRECLYGVVAFCSTI